MNFLGQTIGEPLVTAIHSCLKSSSGLMFSGADPKVVLLESFISANGSPKTKLESGGFRDIT